MEAKYLCSFRINVKSFKKKISVYHVKKATPLFTSNIRRNTSTGICLSYNHPLMTTGLTNRCSWIWTEHPCPYLHLQVSYAQYADVTANTINSSRHESLHINKPWSSGSGRHANNLFWLSPLSLLYSLLREAFLYSQLCILPTFYSCNRAKIFNTMWHTTQFHMRASLPVSIHYLIFLPGCSGFPVSSHNELPDVSWPLLGQRWTRAVLQMFPISLFWTEVSEST